MPAPANTEFDIRGVNHIALVCQDMARTVAFYRDVLGMPLVKTIELPMKSGQHFFFDIGNGDSLAFFWFPDAPAHAPGVSSPRTLPHEGGLVTAHGSMNHLAFNVPAEKFDAYVERLKAKGIEVSPVFNHDDSAFQISAEVTDEVFVRSVYFFDPDGVCLEFAAWTRPMGPADVEHEAATADGGRSQGLVLDAGGAPIQTARTGG
ncbi:VOC family protein [Phenylobacterium parvum]|jgi:catechol 2,3-dioxygenase-like lactoylglutathione lyase family enzyme|uniref:Glyoxalase n=1 Tax=Phenylobacterium parvum TaxID=2201350 RepID=A0A2Z3HRS0_9CAUL|nr:VOC family protein [Phenylobacterium parvum]AWM76856.1 glyoxalase [Phenylobacterium parvum]